VLPQAGQPAGHLCRPCRRKRTKRSLREIDPRERTALGQQGTDNDIARLLPVVLHSETQVPETARIDDVPFRQIGDTECDQRGQARDHDRRRGRIALRPRLRVAAIERDREIRALSQCRQSCKEKKREERPECIHCQSLDRRDVRSHHWNGNSDRLCKILEIVRIETGMYLRDSCLAPRVHTRRS